MAGIVDGAGNGSHDNHHFNGHGIEIGNAVVVGGKAAQRHRRHGVADGVKPAHARPMQRQKTRHGDGKIGHPQLFGHLRNARRQFAVFIHAGDFGFEKLPAAHAEHGQNCHRQHDNPHAAEPIEHMAPKIERRRERVEAVDYAGAGGGEPRHRLEKRIGVAHIGKIEIKRHRGDGGKAHPQHKHQREAVALAQLAVVVPGEQPHRYRADDGDQRGAAECGQRIVEKQIRHKRRHQQQHGKQHAELGEHVDNRNNFMHGAAAFRRPLINFD